MSNLVKQYYVVNSSKETRVINSNEKVEQRLRELREQQQREQYPEDYFQEGFTEGLKVDVVEVEPEVTPEEILEEAKKQAEQIIQEAQEKADALMDDAVNQADALFEEKKKLGYDTGLQTGEEECARRREQLEAELSTQKERLQREYEEKFETMESELIDVITTVFNKVFHIQFEDKREILLHLVKNTLKNIEVGKMFRIHVSESNCRFMESRLEDIRERIGSDVEVEIINDAKLGAADCQIETSFGIFDCSVDMELNNLIKDIRSLCC